MQQAVISGPSHHRRRTRQVTFAAQETSATRIWRPRLRQHAEARRSRASPAPRPPSSATPPTFLRLKQLDLLKAEIAQATAALARASGAQSQAELNLGYTTIVAPIDGVVGNRSLRAGQFVQAGTQLMSVVPVDSAYVVANFKETQLTNVRQGQPVEIAVDMFPGQVVHGRVDSIAPASNWNSRRCRPTTPPAISPRWCSGSR